METPIMAFSPEKENKSPPPWFKHKNVINQVLFKMRLQPKTSKKSQPKSQTQRRRLSLPNFELPYKKSQDLSPTNLVSDITSLLSDEILLNILSKVPKSQRNANSLVSKRWLSLQGHLVRSIKFLNWEFLISGRCFLRFPNLIDVDMVNGSLISPMNSGICCTNKIVSLPVGSTIEGKDWFFNETLVLNTNEIDDGLRVLANGCPNLHKLVVINASEMGILSIAEECPTLQELVLLMCNDRILRGIAACQNLQILRLSGIVDGFYNSLVTDIGLTILAQGCKRLVKLELSGCMGSYEGIKAIGQCCQMLEELTFCNHKMENGWLLALSYCENLKHLRFMSCKKVDDDSSFELDQDLGSSCVALESLHFDKCQLRDKGSLRTLFLLCENVTELVMHNCWGLDDDMFNTATVLRKVRFLSLEGCSVLTTRGLESVIIHWNELGNLKVKSCNNIKDCEVNPALSIVFSTLKDLKWKPDTKSILSANLGADLRKKGSKFFKKSAIRNHYQELIRNSDT